MTEQPDILDVIAQNTIAVLTTAPAHKDEWGQQVFQLHSQARSRNDSAMVALTDTVMALLRGKAVSDLSPDLSGPHAECWHTITEALKQWQQFQDAPPPSPELMQRVQSVESEEELKKLLEEHPELLLVLRQMAEQAQSQQQPGSQIEIPPGFEEDIKLISQLAAQQQRDPTAIPRRIQALKRVLNRLIPGKHLEFRAAVNNDLGAAYSNLPTGDREENLKRAIRCYQAALHIRAIETYPADHRMTSRNLGHLYFGERTWEDALKAYRSAIASGDALLSVSTTEAGRRSEVDETARLFSRAAYCLLQLDKLPDALLMLERGKTRLLAEVLALENADLEMLPENQQEQIGDLRAMVQSRQAELRTLSAAEDVEDVEQRRQALLDVLRDARKRLTNVVEDIRHEHPDFMPTGLELAELLALIPVEGALVAPLMTSQGSAVFVVPHGAKKISNHHVLPLDGVTDEYVNTLLVGSEEAPGWLRAYIDYRNGRIRTTDWNRSIKRITGALWEKLLGPVHEKLEELKVKHVILMPSGGLQLLPLHAAWREEDGKQQTLLDKYAVSYAPSGYALKASQERAAERNGEHSVVGGINKYEQLSPLYNAVDEAEAIAMLFGVDALTNDMVTQQALEEKSRDAAFLHLSCHGAFAWGEDTQRSALYLAGDEPLTLAQILSRTLDLTRNRLVTLSACETGITDIRQSPDEFVGLPAGFIQAGAPAVVSSLWVVDDRSTALLMERFYKNHLEKDLPLSEALREAQLWLRDATAKELGDYYAAMVAPRLSEKVAVEEALTWKSADNPDERPYASPFHWAAFTFTGA